MFVQRALFLFFLFAIPHSAQANDMINNNTAYGFVGGDIIQEVGAGIKSRIEVGSVSRQGARNNNVTARVDGDIIVRSNNKDLVLSIGSVQANGGNQ